MSTVAATCNVKEVVGARVGLELEIEGTNLPTNIPGNLWEVKRDGSLRDGGLEYVFAEPLGSVAAREALDTLAKHFNDVGTKPSYSFRTSTHVHVNVSNLKMDQVKAIVAIFTLFDEEYINFCARTRKANRFCLATKDADGVVEQVRRFLVSGSIPNRDRGKYSAMNLCTLSQFGTLEFRTLEGTNDFERVFTWIRALLALRKAGKELGTVQAVLAMDKEELAKLVFPTERLKAQFLKDGWQERFEYNKSVAWDAFAPFVKD